MNNEPSQVNGLEEIFELNFPFPHSFISFRARANLDGSKSKCIGISQQERANFRGTLFLQVFFAYYVRFEHWMGADEG
jgi:hypothetical protein